MAIEDRKGVIEAFDKIASEFSNTRRTPWPSLKELGDCRGARVLDLGTGTGRNSKALVEMGADCVVSADISLGMLRQLRKNSKSFNIIHPVRCDALYLPFRENCFERVAFFATIHHIQSRRNRELSMEEVARVMNRGGRSVVTAWSRTQTRFIKHSPIFLSRWLKGGEFGDVLVSWNSETDRFYHLFTKAELVGTVKNAGLKVSKAYGEKIRSRFLPENWVVVSEKVDVN